MDVPPKTAPRLFLIDAYALIYRAFFAFINRPLTNSKGENTSAPFGFANFLVEIRDKYQPDYLAVVFDAGNSHREKVYPEYKATREKMPDELRASLPRVRELVAAFNGALVQLEGYEADDVIGTLAIKARDAGLEAVIVSGDKDLYQLVGPGIHLLNPGRGGRTGVAAEWVDERNAHEKFGIPATKVVDYLALIGDSSDNIPGARGVGPKTALKLLDEYGSVDEILEHASDISAKRVRESLTEHADQVRISRQLVTLMTDLDVELDLKALEVREPDRPRLHRFFAEMEFRRLMERFAPGGAPASDEGVVDDADPDSLPSDNAAGTVPATVDGPPPVRCHLVIEPDDVGALVGQARKMGRVALGVQNAFLDPHRAGLVGFALAVDVGEASYLSFGHVPHGEPTLAFESTGIANLPEVRADSLAALVNLLEDPNVEKVGADLKTAALSLARSGVCLRGMTFDVTLASYVLDPGRRKHDLDVLCQDFLGFSLTPYNDVVGTGQKRISFSEVDQETARDYACQGVDAALRLGRALHRASRGPRG